MKTALWTQRIVALVFILVGLTLAAGGAILAVSGGSFYYLLTGLAVIASGVLIWRGDGRGIWLYGAMLIWTVAWSVWEVGFIGWQLAPRLIAPFVLATTLLLPPIRKLDPSWSAPRHARGWPTFAGGVALAIVLGSIGHGLGPADPDLPVMRRGTQEAAPAVLPQPLARIERDDWESYGNDSSLLSLRAGGRPTAQRAHMSFSRSAGPRKAGRCQKLTWKRPGEMSASCQKQT